MYMCAYSQSYEPVNTEFEDGDVINTSIAIKNGNIHLRHWVNGIRHIPYTETSEFDFFIFRKLICKQGKYIVIHLVVDKMTALKYADYVGSMCLQYNTSKVKELLENTCVNMSSGTKNKMKKVPSQCKFLKYMRVKHYQEIFWKMHVITCENKENRKNKIERKQN